MENLSSLIQKQITQIIISLYPGQAIEANISQSTQAQFGHYQCNSSMQLAKIVGKNPRIIAEEIIKKWDVECMGTIGASLEVAGPGFINITMDRQFLSDELNKMALDARLGVPPLDKKKENYC